MSLKKVLIERFGEHRVSDFTLDDEQTSLLVMNVELKSPVTIISTNGLSDYKMPVSEMFLGYEHVELCFCLPSYWEWEHVNSPNVNWIYNWLKKLPKYVIEKETWFGHGHTLPNGKDKVTFSELTKQNHLIFAAPYFLDHVLFPVEINGKKIHFLCLIPLFQEEFDLKQKLGTYKFFKKFYNKGGSEILDDFRTSITKKRWFN